MDMSSQTEQPPDAQSDLLGSQNGSKHPTSSPIDTAVSPPSSSTSSPRSVAERRSRSPISLDLGSIPPLTQPSPPSNTLLITQLNDFRIFHPASLATIRQHITEIAPLHSFAPLKSLRRIICSFYDVDAAVKVRQQLDNVALLNELRPRIYFGEPTPIGETKKFLDRPDAGRLFFISPPPSPPVGWQMKEEDAPNKDVVAADLAEALGKLSGKMNREPIEEAEAVASFTLSTDEPSPTVDGKTITTSSTTPTPVQAASSAGTSASRNRSRSSTIIYDPEAHGDSPALPAVMVEDTSSSMEWDTGLNHANDTLSHKEPITMTHTSRPPVELMG